MRFSASVLRLFSLSSYFYVDVLMIRTQITVQYHDSDLWGAKYRLKEILDKYFCSKE